MTDNFQQSPFVSIVIPSYNRKESLLRTLNSLGQQTYPADQVEVIVVDDGGNDGTEEVAGLTYPFRLRYHRQNNRGDAIARNIGAQLAVGVVLVFIDDDIVAAPECIAGFVEDLMRGNRRVVIGMLRSWPRQDATPFETVNAKIWEERIAVVGEVNFSDCLSGFLSLRRRHFFELGMMQPVTLGGSSVWCDVEFAYRAYQSGFRFFRSATAIGYHDDYAFSDLSISNKRMERAAQAAVPLFARHPELSSYIPVFLDKSPIAWLEDPPSLIAHKLTRQIASSPPVLQGLEGFVRILEARYPSPMILERLYRWIGSAYLYRGYRKAIDNDR